MTGGEKERLRQAIAAGRGDLDVYQRMAALLLEEGDLTGLLSLWQTCPYRRDGDPADTAFVAYEEGQALFLLGRSDEAAERFAAAARSADADAATRGSELAAYAWYFAAKAFLGVDRGDALSAAAKAVDAFNRFLESDAGYAAALEAHSFLGELWGMVGDDEKSLACHRRYLALADPSDTDNRISSLIGVAEIQRRRKEPEGALATLEEAVAAAGEDGPMKAGALLGIGLIRYDRGEYEAARGALEEAIEAAGPRGFAGADTVAAEAEIHLAAVSLKEGEPRRALSLIVVALRDLPTAHPLRVHAELLTGACRVALGEIEKGVAHYRRALNDPAADDDQKKTAQAALAGREEA